MAYLYRTPPSSPDAQKRKTICPLAPIGKRSDKIISIPFPMMYQENRFSTRVNPNASGAQIKSQKRLLETTLDDFKKELFPGFSDSLRKKIEKNKLKSVKSSECTWAPMKSGTKRKTTQEILTLLKKRLF
jgi:hypothetical protein